LKIWDDTRGESALNPRYVDDDVGVQFDYTIWGMNGEGAMTTLDEEKCEYEW
jgi:hypothetical protein